LGKSRTASIPFFRLQVRIYLGKSRTVVGWVEATKPNMYGTKHFGIGKSRDETLKVIPI
jgi:3-deoxy-D-arabino-heptulosonate 7-phosphate (DAHP) synthase